MGTGNDEPRFQIDDLGAVIIVLACLTLVAFDKQSVALLGIIHIVIGFMFGKRTRKKRD